MREAKAFAIDPAAGSCIPPEAGLLAGAERELAAFARAVNDLFGSEQAQRAAEDWIEELELMDLPTGKAAPDWRCLTIAAASRLANRVNFRPQGNRISA